MLLPQQLQAKKQQQPPVSKLLLTLWLIQALIFHHRLALGTLTLCVRLLALTNSLSSLQDKGEWFTASICTPIMVALVLCCWSCP